MSNSPLRLVIDTDPGVDDAVAIAWLLTQTYRPVQIVGISVVAGNAPVAQGVNNLLTLLHLLGRTDIPVAIGAERPRHYALSRTNRLVHGPDGLWGAAKQPPYDTARCQRDVAAFYRKLTEQHGDLTLLALGPLTNLAQAERQLPGILHRFQEVIALGGTKAAGSVTPVAEYNFWQDPHAAAHVLATNLPLTLILRDTFAAFTLTAAEIDQICAQETAVMRLLASPLQRYTGLYTGMGRAPAATIPDLVAAIYAIAPEFGQTRPALIEVMTDPGLTRGQSIIALTFGERVTLMADDEELGDLAERALADPEFNMMARLDFIARRKPDNARVVSSINVEEMRHLLHQTW